MMTSANIKSLMPLTDEDLFRKAPAVMADHASPDTSKIYRQVKTIDVINIMRDQGWMPVAARQVNVRLSVRKEFAKHEIRFARIGDQTLSKVGDETLQAIMTNSHDRLNTFMFQLGVFRLACLNGLVVAKNMFSEMRIRHVGFDPKDVIDTTASIIEGGKRVADHIQEMREITLEPSEQLTLAALAAPLLLSGIESGYQVINPKQLLIARRATDEVPNLWNTFNVIQENVIKGGMSFYRKNEEKGKFTIAPDAVDRLLGVPKVEGIATPASGYSKSRTRAVKSIDHDLELNQSLWSLAEQVRRSKLGIPERKILRNVAILN